MVRSSGQGVVLRHIIMILLLLLVKTVLQLGLPYRTKNVIFIQVLVVHRVSKDRSIYKTQRVVMLVNIGTDLLAQLSQQLRTVTSIITPMMPVLIVLIVKFLVWENV